MRKLIIACALLTVVAPQVYAADIAPAATNLPAGTYTLDKAHGSLIVRLNHMGFSHFTARFSTFDVKLHVDLTHPENAKMEASVDPASLSTDNPPSGFLDELRGAQWLNVVAFPQVTYRATKIEITSPNTARITGDLSLHGVTLPMIFEATFNGGYAGFAMDPHARIGFSAHGSFNCSPFGVAYGVPAPGARWV